MAAIAKLHFPKAALVFIMLARSSPERRHRQLTVAWFLARGE